MLMERTGGAGLKMFDPVWIGLPVALAVLIFVLLFSARLLPERKEPLAYGEDMREYMAEMLVDPASSLAGSVSRK